jgi:O-antigen/teichoic acid export membrane protein
MSQPSATGSSREHLRELLRNQVWQSANFLAKALFLVLLTPLMLARWGAEQYGLFALASSLLVSLALLDGGVRALTRLRLAKALASDDMAAWRQNFTEGVATFAVVVLAAFLVTLAGGLAGWWSAIFHLPAGGDRVLVVTVALTGLMMLSILVLEPLAARGELSVLKAASTWGALIALPLCALAVWLGCGPLAAISIYALSLFVPNLAVALRRGILRDLVREPAVFSPKTIVRTLRSGFWFYLTTVSLVLKTHALTFVVSAIAGPAEAGLFYILLRLAEIVGNVGATASETTLAALAATHDAKERAARFRQTWLYVGACSIGGALVFVTLCEPLLHWWLPREQTVPWLTGPMLAIFGLGGAFSRVVMNASMGLGLIRPAARAGVLEAALDVVCGAVALKLGGIPALLLGGSVGALVLLPTAGRIAARCDSSNFSLYVRPLGVLAPGFLLAALTQSLAVWLAMPWAWGLALAISAGVGLQQLRRIHAAH